MESVRYQHLVVLFHLKKNTLGTFRAMVLDKICDDSTPVSTILVSIILFVKNYSSIKYQIMLNLVEQRDITWECEVVLVYEPKCPTMRGIGNFRGRIIFQSLLS